MLLMVTKQRNELNGLDSCPFKISHSCLLKSLVQSAVTSKWAKPNQKLLCFVYWPWRLGVSLSSKWFNFRFFTIWVPELAQHVFHATFEDNSLGGRTILLEELHQLGRLKRTAKVRKNMLKSKNMNTCRKKILKTLSWFSKMSLRSKSAKTMICPVT